MAAESIINFKKPEFPKIEKNENGTTTRIEYIGNGVAAVGDAATIIAALPTVGSAWGDYSGQVKTVTYEPTENVEIIEAFITLESTKDNAEPSTGELKSVSYEIRWVSVERDMLEHPQFAIGGGGENALTTGDIYDIELWKAPENTRELRDEYKYNSNGYHLSLHANARLFARGIELGQETFDDKAPVAIKISEYVNGPPPETTAGMKEDPIGFPNLPSGFEWRKETADSTRAGGATKWNLTEEWNGAKKVLHDRLKIYWEPPTTP